MTDYSVNIINFTFVDENTKIYSSSIAFDDSIEVSDKLIQPEYRSSMLFNQDKVTYIGITPPSNSFTEEVTEITFPVTENNFYVNKSLQKRILTQVLHKHLIAEGLIVSDNFIHDVEVWLKNKEKSNDDYYSFKRVTLKIELNSMSNGFCILISYDGKSYLYKKPLSGILNQISTINVSRVCFKNKIVRFGDVFESDYSSVFVKLNRELARDLSIDIFDKYEKPGNKYMVYLNEIISFYEKHLAGKSLQSYIRIVPAGFVKVNRLLKTSYDSNSLVFKNGRKNINVFDGLKEAKGPFEESPLKNIKFIFIFEKGDNKHANNLYSYLKKGYKNYPGLELFVGVPFSIDTSKSIIFDNEVDLFDKIKTTLDGLSEKENYFAIYLSPIRKDDKSDDNLSRYYKIKEQLLKKNITSQVIFRENLDNPNFNYFLPNISIAILAKLQGKPWRLPNPPNKDLVLGFGVYKNRLTNQEFIGNAVCFKTDGSFEEFDVFQDADITKIGELLKEYISTYIEKNKTCRRLIVHYYKDISHRDEKIISNVLTELGLPIPYIVININDTYSKDYIVFDNNYTDLMPVSGTIIPIKHHQFLLFNNTRYSEKAGQRIQDFYFPIKIKVFSNNKDQIADFEVLQELIGQVYQFSRIYWKSVKQGNKPVTIEYSEMVANIVSHFENKTLPDTFVAKKTLWFL